MTLTTGALLRRIIETPLSASAHKLATLILDGIAWKDGYNGLDHGTAAFTLAHLAERMGVSRQHLSDLLSELAESNLALTRWKPNGKYAPWIFRVGGQEEDIVTPDVASAAGDTSLYRESKNKTIFAGRIELRAETNVYACHPAGSSRQGTDHYRKAQTAEHGRRRQRHGRGRQSKLQKRLPGRPEQSRHRYEVNPARRNAPFVQHHQLPPWPRQNPLGHDQGHVPMAQTSRGFDDHVHGRNS